MSAPVSSAPVWDVINGFTAYRALCTALDLGVFELLATGPLDACGVTDALAADAREPVSVLLDTLVALGLLETAADNGYILTPAAARYLVANSPASMVALVRHSPGPEGAWSALATSLRAGGPPDSVAAEIAAFYPDLAEATAPTQTAVASAVWQELANRGRWPAGARVLDLGCGSGAWLCALLAQDDAATGTGVELPGVVPVARNRIRGAGLEGRVELVAGDYLTTSLPTPGADVVVLAHVLRAEPEERAIALLHKAIRLAGPHGTVVVADYPRPDATADRSAACIGARHELLLALTVFAATGGTGVTAGALRRWCAAADAEVVAELEPIPRQHVYLIRTRAEGSPHER